MKKTIINVVLALAIIGVAYLLYQSIREPIDFEAAKAKRQIAVIQKLKKIRVAQDVYRSVTSTFAPNFDTLEYVLKNGKVAVYKVNGDPDDPTNVDAFTIDTSYYNAIDTIVAMGINVDSLRYVPYSNNAVFEIYADTISYQKTTVSVVEVGVKKKKFMGMYADPKYSRYDSRYNPEDMVKFGSRTEPNTAGNWE